MQMEGSLGGPFGFAEKVIGRTSGWKFREISLWNKMLFLKSGAD